MALEFSDFGLSPEEQVASRKKALESFANVAGPAQREQQARERGQLLTEAYVAAGQAARGRQPATDVLAQAQSKAAEMFPGQAAKEDALNLQGAKYREDIISSRQEAAVKNYETKTDEMKQQQATQIANRAFELNISNQQLALANDGYLADEGLKRLYQDYEAGRANKEEVFQLSSKLALEAQNMKYQIDQEAAQLKGQLEVDLANNDLAAAKARIKKLLERQKDVMLKAAKANNIASIISGAFTIGGAVVGGIYGGPTGAATGASISSGAGKVVSGIATS